MAEIVGHSAHAVTRLYREMLRTAKRLPDKERVGALEEIRATFRKNLNETDRATIDRLLKLGESKLSYIKIVTPRVPKAGKSSFVFERDGTVREGTGGVAPRTQRAGIYPDEIARHKYLMERQHFMHRK